MALLSDDYHLCRLDTDQAHYRRDDNKRTVAATERLLPNAVEDKDAILSACGSIDGEYAYVPGSPFRGSTGPAESSAHLISE